MIKTKASVVKNQDLQKSFKAVKVEKPQRLPKTKPPHQKIQENNSSDEEFNRIFGDGDSGPRKPKRKKNEVTFDSARREILNFGLSGKSTDEKSNKTEELLIKLGARPLKNKAKNYKMILDEKKKLKHEGDSVNKRALFGTSASLQYRSQQKKKPKDTGLLKKYGRIEKGDRQHIKKMMDKNKRK